jgi:hypothetical protein
MRAMVAINSMPQHLVANGSGQSEFFLAKPTTSFSFVCKKTFTLVAIWHINNADILF